MATKLSKQGTAGQSQPATARADGASAPYAIYGRTGGVLFPVYLEYTLTSIVANPNLDMPFLRGVELAKGATIQANGWYGVNLEVTAQDPGIANDQFASVVATLILRAGVTGPATYDLTNGIAWSGEQIASVYVNGGWSRNPAATQPANGIFINRTTAVRYLMRGTKLGLYLIGGNQLFAGGDLLDPNNYQGDFTSRVAYKVELFLMAAGALETVGIA